MQPDRYGKFFFSFESFSPFSPCAERQRANDAWTRSGLLTVHAWGRNASRVPALASADLMQEE